MHHDQFDNIRLVLHRFRIDRDFRILRLLCYALQLVKGILRDSLQEAIHALIALKDHIAEKLLGVRSGLSTCPSFNIFLHLFPIFTV